MSATEPSFTVSRVVAAPVERAWEAWTDADLIRRWWGPQGFVGSAPRVDFREGGTTLVGMSMEGGPELFNTWTYTGIVDRRRIEFVSRFADGSGAEVDPAQVGLPPSVPSAVRHVVTFEAVDDGAKVTVEEFDYEPGSMLEQSKMGQEQVMDKFAALFPAK